MAFEIGKTIRELQVRQEAYKTLLSRLVFENHALNWRETIEMDVKQDLLPSSPFGQTISQLEAALARSPDDSLLRVLYSQIFLPQ